MSPHRRRLEILAQELATELSGAIFLAEQFTMVAYPVGSTAWSFLDEMQPAVPEGAMIRFAVRAPINISPDGGKIARFLDWKQENELKMTALTGGSTTKKVRVISTRPSGISSRSSIASCCLHGNLHFSFCSLRPVLDSRALP